MAHHEAIALSDFAACLKVRVKTHLKNRNRTARSMISI